ncbi:HNH endonuclease [Mycolicibacterium septicum]|uniref:HNH endonuclease n=1 Tax=Mycolicibacterium septicum TaxID=98668 RepID=UPI0023E1A913|nr:hypothetical protein [Mycolicibacterium septicum]
MEAAQACVSQSRSRNREIDTALQEALSDFDVNSKAYQQAGKAGALHTLTAADFPSPGSLSPERVKWLYKQRLKNPGRKAAYAIYVRLRSSGPNGYCAYCRYQNAGTLDHFLPKAEFGMLAIEPWNLVPCCTECNGNRNERSPDSRLIHPNFLDHELGRWLYGSVVTHDPVLIEFFAEPAERIGEDLGQRVRDQFRALKLADLYSKVAADTIANAKADLRRSGGNLQIDDARAHLLDESMRAFDVNPNFLRGVVYEALANDETFIRNMLASQ